MSMTRKFKKAAVAVVAAGALLFAGAAGANALTYTPDPVPSGATAAVTSDSSLGAGDYRLGVCTYKKYGIPAVPACGAMNQVNGFAGGILTDSTGPIKKFTNANEHYGVIGLFGQPKNFDCDQPNACRVVIVKHNLITHSFVEEAPLEVQ